MLTNQAIARRSHSYSFMFTGKPSEETRKKLLAAGYQFDGKSRQWYRRDELATVVSEADVLDELALVAAQEGGADHQAA